MVGLQCHIPTFWEPLKTLSTSPPAFNVLQILGYIITPLNRFACLILMTLVTQWPSVALMVLCIQIKDYMAEALCSRTWTEQRLLVVNFGYCVDVCSIREILNDEVSSQLVTLSTSTLGKKYETMSWSIAICVIPLSASQHHAPCTT